MGQKVNPVGMRVGINREWESRWYADKKDYATFLNEDIKIRKYVEKNLNDALVSATDVERSKETVVAHAEPRASLSQLISDIMANVGRVLGLGREMKKLGPT